MAVNIRYIAILLAGLICPLISSAYTFRFRGKVVDETGSPLTGATVRSVDNGRATVTGIDGEFIINADKNAAKIEVSYIGFIQDTFILKNHDASHVELLALAPDISALEEVVVTATRTPKALKDVPAVTQLICRGHKESRCHQHTGFAHRGVAGPGIQLCNESGDLAQHERLRRQGHPFSC